ncbi:hypothetical protein HY480_03285 [Candidatus Uhrbacteria bacterium]|nr:hypothetical protein [Candidatus Uhrbacteria bacterium]
MHPIHQRIIEINRDQSTRYIADDAARRRYWAQHPTFFAAVKCMDGRVLFPTMTRTPLGLVKPFRAIGGKFEIWWPSFLGRMRHWVDTAMGMGSRSFVFVTYHFSASDPHLGCAGWAYDVTAARAHAMNLARALEEVFGEQLTAVVTAIETDHDTLILHGPEGDVSGSACMGKSTDDIRTLFRSAFPNMVPEVIEDLIPFLRGNAAHVADLTAHPRALTARGHNERVIALGQGFNWLAQANLALIINDADPDLNHSIRVAAGIIEKNLAGAPTGDDATVLTCVTYREPGMDERQACARSRGLREFAVRVIRASHPQFLASGRLHTMAAVVWEPSKRLEVIDVSPA